MKYPAGIKNKITSVPVEKLEKKSYSHSHSNRGMLLEEDINETNKFYNCHDVAVIHKKPTPIQVVNVGNGKGDYSTITKAFFQSKSTTDYNGIYRNKYIDFEAKETKNKTTFPLTNFHEHQIRHMEKVIKHGAICFAIIRFTTRNETYLVKSSDIIFHYNKMDTTKKKSMSYKTIKEIGELIPLQFKIRLDYLPIVDKLFFN